MKTSTEPLIYTNDQQLAGKLRDWFGTEFGAEKKCCLVCVSDNCVEVKKYGIISPQPGSINRVLVIFLGRPIDLNAMGSWREWAVSTVCGSELRMDSLSKGAGEADFRTAIDRNCAGWFAAKPGPEKQGLELGEWVTMPKEKTAKDDPSLLTMMFGSMGELLTEVEVVARRFSEAVEKLGGEANSKYLKKIDSLLKDGGGVDAKSGSAARKESPKPDDLLGIGNVTDQLPKLLLRGESGVGKTLIAEYLHKRCELDGWPLHISIPEYLGKEDMFEYTLFGYAAGNYTGGRKEGDHGLLLENLGGVVFLDEIGEANAAIQAKLLTFLDHYRVRPRGWLGDPFYCPVLVVAATNRDLNETTDGKPRFRRDLLARFTDRHTIPALRDRKQDFEFILDCLLQRQSMNPGQFVREIGAEAMAFLKEKDYRDGNFRELEDLFRDACKKAKRDDRPYLIRTDFKES
ncbi:MAG: sigma 54-interacting transcriptional regulator [Verrucomicrobiota bacterium]